MTDSDRGTGAWRRWGRDRPASARRGPEQPCWWLWIDGSHGIGARPAKPHHLRPCSESLQARCLRRALKQTSMLFPKPPRGLGGGPSS
ncbi:hypothetical protein [Nocardioides mangrovi]|uniref:Uncharacterized protein n=1 Tax=Nocardioides mangrovi TaxID=2874580 RepID=A0ABS7UDW8_9ACTN|nr:hypothetical protein [Nocardioides mangrovi]MBZ5738977.1 hypothetical protein [Nocardioides mangrovi]